MRTIFKTGLAILAAAGAVSLASVAWAANPDQFAEGPYESYLIEHCTYNPCDIDYSTMPNWPSNPANRHPQIRVYEHPYDQDEDYPPPPEDEYQDEGR